MRYDPDKRFLRSRYLQQGQGQIKVIPRHCTATYLNQYPYQVSISYTLQFLRYSLEKKLKIKVTKARSKVKSRSHFNVAHLHPPINVPILRFNLLHLIVSEISPRQDFKGQGDYSKVKGHVKVTPLHCTPKHSNQYPYQISTSYMLWLPRYSPDKIFKVKVTLGQGQRSNQGHIMMLHTNSP